MYSRKAHLAFIFSPNSMCREKRDDKDGYECQVRVRHLTYNTYRPIINVLCACRARAGIPSDQSRGLAISQEMQGRDSYILPQRPQPILPTQTYLLAFSFDSVNDPSAGNVQKRETTLQTCLLSRNDVPRLWVV